MGEGGYQLHFNAFFVLYNLDKNGKQMLLSLHFKCNFKSSASLARVHFLPFQVSCPLESKSEQAAAALTAVSGAAN